AFIEQIVPAGTPVLRAAQGMNRVAQPVIDHIFVTELFTRRLRTNVNTYDDPAPESDPGTKIAEMGTEVHVQVDFYGLSAAGWAQAFETLFRDEYAAEALAPTCAPLYADEARMIPLVTGEEQYLNRWAVTAHLQYNPSAVTPQQFADQMEIT